jgi:hypothetical protein
LANWNEVLKEITAEASRVSNPLDTVRRQYLKKLFDYTGRNVIAYYSGWLSKPGIQLLDINDEDMNGFMMAVHRLDRNRGLDLILHTPGGSIASTEAIVGYLHQVFASDIRVIVPQVAMSAGTMIACSSREILLGKQSSLGPIDPQIRGVPAQGVINEFKQALEDYKIDNHSIVLWQQIIGKYQPTFLGQCKQAIDWTNAFVSSQLETIMFAGDPDAKEKAERIVQALGDTDAHKAHERHIPFNKCKEMGLKVRMLEEDNELQDLVLTSHHCFIHTLMNSPAYKIIENHLGVAFIKAQVGK